MTGIERLPQDPYGNPRVSAPPIPCASSTSYPASRPGSSTSTRFPLGEMIPFFLARIDAVVTPFPKGPARSSLAGTCWPARWPCQTHSSISAATAPLRGIGIQALVGNSLHFDYSSRVGACILLKFRHALNTFASSADMYDDGMERSDENARISEV